MVCHAARTFRILAAAALFLLAGAPAAADPLSVQDIASLIEAGIGEDLVVRQATRSGLAFEPGVEEMLTLRRAGAGDDLLAAILDLGETAARAESPRTGTPTGSVPVRVYVDRHEGRPALVLTNLAPDGRRLDGAPAAPVRGVISSSERSDGRPAAPPDLPPDMEPAPALPAPAAVEVTVRHEGGERDERLARLEERLDDLESGEDVRPPVGADLPRHPINDFREYPVWGGWGWGVPVPPVILEPQEFTVTPYGPSSSFTAAREAGFDPFRPVPPCTPGVACSVHQRLAHP